MSNSLPTEDPEANDAGQSLTSNPLILFFVVLAATIAISSVLWWVVLPLAGQSGADQKAVEEGVYYEGCNEVRALGKAPLHRGDPGYGLHMDGDGDGIACEPRPDE